jgi:transposase
MQPQLFVSPLTADQRDRLNHALRSPDAFTVRRAQILLTSADGKAASAIAREIRCTSPTVRNAIHAFRRDGLDCLVEKSSRPRTTRPVLDQTAAEPLRAILHQSPRIFGQPTSLWTLNRLAQVCFAKGFSPRLLSGETIRVALKRLGIGWKRAKHWITSPDPAYTRKKHARDRLIRLAALHPNWVLGYQDETWWSRLALPALHAWAAEDEPLRLVERATPKGDTDPKALSCYGLLRADTGGMMLRFVTGRPVGQVTEDYLGWVCERLRAEGKKALLLVWDNAAWHVSKRVRAWIKAHNRKAKEHGGVRIVACHLPVKAPWLNAIEPKWAHGKQAIVEPDRLLSATEVQDRVCSHYHCESRPPLVQLTKKKVA